MAAIDPSTKARHADVTNDDQPSRATLKMVFDPSGGGTDDSEDSDDEDAYLKALQDGVESDGLSDEEDEDSEDEEQNGGPSDPSKSTKARKEAAAQSILDALEHQESDEENKDAMDTDQTPKVNGLANSNASKGKGKAKVEDDEDEQDSESESAAERLEEVVICTLDTSKVCRRVQHRFVLLQSLMHALDLSTTYRYHDTRGPDDLFQSFGQSHSLSHWQLRTTA